MIFVHFFPFIVLQEIVSYITLLWWKSRHNYLQIQVIHCINDTQSSKHIYRSGNVSRINISNIVWFVLLFPVQTIHVGRGMVKFANMLQLLFLYFLISHINFFIRKNVKNFSNLSNKIVEIRLGIFMFRNFISQWFCYAELFISWQESGNTFYTGSYSPYYFLLASTDAVFMGQWPIDPMGEFASS